mmetsp:Transcript_31264/g.61728  ORF Transcript_31264/g.61728 Transcript_31264/m.61728 type:complete len:175 (+) Transcript_31264:643-1167(+)
MKSFLKTRKNRTWPDGLILRSHPCKVFVALLLFSPPSPVLAHTEGRERTLTKTKKKKSTQRRFRCCSVLFPPGFFVRRLSTLTYHRFAARDRRTKDTLPHAHAEREKKKSEKERGEFVVEEDGRRERSRMNGRKKRKNVPFILFSSFRSFLAALVCSRLHYKSKSNHAVLQTKQ